MGRPVLAAQQLRTPEERARSLDAALDRNMYSESGGITLWRASQLAAGFDRVVSCGHTVLGAELPGGGWPAGALTELLTPQPGCGELRLLQPALATVASRPLLMLQPPHRLQPAGLAWLGIPAARACALHAPRTADALWAAEQILRAGTCGALLFWQTEVRQDALRRLHLAAQASDTLLFLFRPLAAAQSTSPAPLRLALRAARGGLEVTFVKRRGPQRDEPVFVSLVPSPVLLSRYATLDRRTSAAPRPRVVSPALVDATQ
ncbi:protein ImuA [Paraburkholderia fungorum]|nr:protein ImuA [Paraburkholderia fungorum]